MGAVASNEVATTVTPDRSPRHAVLAYVDGARDSEAARIAGSLASALDCRLVLAAIPQLPPHTPPGGDVTSALARRTRTVLDDMAEALAPGTEVRIAFGDPTQRLLALARREAALLIVIAGRSAPSPTPGSRPVMSDRLIDKAPCPVLVLRHR